MGSSERLNDRDDMKYLLFQIVFSFLLWTNHYAYAIQDKSAPMQEMVYEEQFRSMLIYPEGNLPQARLEPAISTVGASNLWLEFDELADVFDNYFVSFVHCNSNWVPSGLFDMDYLDEYNEFPIRDYNFSRSTMVNYVHYRFRLPSFKRSGNYLLQVYRNRDKKQMVFTRRFMITENSVSVNARSTFSEGVDQRDTHQQLQFTVAYNNLDLNNPMNEVKIVLRQNQRWDNTVEGLKPFRVDVGNKILDYRGFDLKNNFPGGNEYRFFDARTLMNRGQNVLRLEKDPNFMIAILGQDEPRQSVAYSETLDLNGRSLYENRDPGGNMRDPDYILAEFFLSTPPVEGEVVLVGTLTDFGSFPESRMTYSAEAGGYLTSVFVKQGWHDYLYEVRGSRLPSWYLEGSHFETENRYEIFVYYRPIGERGDRLIGYQKIMANNRRN
jgi:hypothetical protein